jgi:hypothetical protein
MDPDPDAAISVINLQDANKKLFVYPKFFAYYSIPHSVPTWFQAPNGRF